MESVKAEMLNVLAVIAFFCACAVFGWALVSLACSVRYIVRLMIGWKKRKGRKDG